MLRIRLEERVDVEEMSLLQRRMRAAGAGGATAGAEGAGAAGAGAARAGAGEAEARLGIVRCNGNG